ncbi:MAG TPA: cytochrome c-type biogenesis protein [Myxococcales bacterium]|nr:cytochrome c-type biogenesis protein [Myxococcales bacterium]
MASEMLPPEQEARVQRIGEQLRCAVCQGLSIAASPSSIARAQLDTVRDLVREGKSDQEIRDYFVARYGEWVLLTPKAEGANWLVWLGPGFLLVVGAFAIARTLRGPRAAPAPKPPEATPAAAPDDEYLRRVREEVDG